jgi:hypothetical protein
MLDLVPATFETEWQALTRQTAYRFVLSCRHHQEMKPFSIKVDDVSAAAQQSNQVVFENILKDLPDQFAPETARDWLRYHHTRAKKSEFLRYMKLINNSTPITAEDKQSLNDLYRCQ